MSRAGTLLILAVAVAAAGCSDATDVPGAMFRGPAAVAVFDGIVAHEAGTYRPYLAVANERGDELRLVDLTDNELVESPGLVFPLSIPVDGRPLLMASADLNDGELPDALAVVAAGSNVIEFVDTWSGHPSVVLSVDLGQAYGEDFEVLSLAAAPLPSAAPAGALKASGSARFLAGLSSPAGSRLAILTVVRSGAGIALVSTVTMPLEFRAIGLAPGAAADVVYAATRDEYPLASGTYGAVKMTLPAEGGASFALLDAGVGTEAVAVATFDAWDFPDAGVPQADTWGAAVERVIAVPAATDCGAPPKPVACGLLALDPLTQALVNDPLAEGPTLIPVAIPATVVGLLATGRTAAALLPIVSGAGTTSTTGLAVVTATDGGIYLVDLARWRIASETSPVSGTGKTRVSAASTVDVTPIPASGLGLWPLFGAAAADISADTDLLPARIRVTPGFTPDDDWTLAWRGILPGLETRGAIFGVSGATRTLSVQIGVVDPLAVADLPALGVADGDRVDIGPVEGHCTGTTQLVVSGAPVGSQVTLVPVAPATWTELCLADVADGTGVVATIRSGGLVLVGARSGLALRPEVRAAAPTSLLDEATLPGAERLFYVTDACDADCVATWQAPPYALTFPLPEGPTLGLSVGFLDPDPDWEATVTDPSRETDVLPADGAALRFTTRSGLVPTRRHPIDDGTSIASALPSGVTLTDTGVSGVGVQVYASYTAGLVVILSTGSAANSMTVLR